MNCLSKSLLSVMTFALLCCGCADRGSENSHAGSEIKIPITQDPLSLDPRLVRDLPTATVMRMLYEGLMRTDSTGAVVPAAAETVKISNDKKTYTFTLRQNQWSDGTPVTADDFVQTWQSVLTPAFPAPNAYQLYLIKGAKDAKEGRASPESIGVKALNPTTLVIELEQPAPYFLEMTSCHFFFPASPAMRQAAASTEFDKVVGNGPFMQDRWKRRSEFSVVKNPHYWDAPQVNLERVTLVTLDENTALQLYNAGSLDWAGSPLSTMPQDAVATLKKTGKLHVASGAGTHWFRLNTEKAPFNNEKMRRAFALALNRKAIVEHVTQGNQQPAIGIIPPAFGFSHQDYFADNDVATAQKLFQEALEENKMTKATMPAVSLRYAANDRNHKIAQAVQQQWSKAFDIPVTLDSSETQVLLDRLRSGDYQISMGSWYADIRDPINFLEIFKSKTNPTNQTFWESPQYTTLLDQSSLELDPAERTLLLEQAEKVLIDGMPVIPLFHSAYNYMKNDQVTGVYFSPLGYLDFKEASKAP